MDGMDRNGQNKMDNGRWTMDNGHGQAIRPCLVRVPSVFRPCSVRVRLRVISPRQEYSSNVSRQLLRGRISEYKFCIHNDANGGIEGIVLLDKQAADGFPSHAFQWPCNRA
jgi:hypothetical protein